MASFLTDVSPGTELTLRMTLVGHDDLGREREWWRGERKLPFEPWLSRALEPLALTMPERRALAVLRLALEDSAGRVLHRNFTAFVVGDGPAPREESLRADGQALRVLRVAPDGASAARWTLRDWTAISGKKRNGAGRRLLRVPAALAEGLEGRRRRERLVPGRARGEAALRQGPAGQGPARGRFHARRRHARPRPQPERLPDDRHEPFPERRARAS